jgi:cell division septal protein FtsQ
VVDCERNVLREVSLRKRIEDTKKNKNKNKMMMKISCATLAMMSAVFFFVVVFLCKQPLRPSSLEGFLKQTGNE